MNNYNYILKNVSKVYSINNEEHVVINNISMNIFSKDITVILGESGCGKTTLIRLIAGLEGLTSGKIEFSDGTNMYKPKVGLVFQESRLMPWLNVYENIGFHSKGKLGFKNSFINRIKRNKKEVEMQKEIDSYIKLMKLDKFKNSYPHELSGGMAQRVSIARALSFNPDMLLMDEPFSALDYFTRNEMQNEVIRIHETMGKGVIFVTHDIDEAIKIGKRIIVFTKNLGIKEFKINEKYNRDLTESYYGNLKKQILKALKEENNNEN